MVLSVLFSLALAAPITHDCGAAPLAAGTYPTCRDYFDTTGDPADEVCVTLDAGPSTLCEQKHVLIFPVDNGPGARLTLSQLSAEMASLMTDYWEGASYGRVYLHVDIVGESGGTRQIVWRDGARYLGRPGKWIDLPGYEVRIEDPTLHSTVLADPAMDFGRYDAVVNLASDQIPAQRAASRVVPGYSLDDGANTWTGRGLLAVVRQKDGTDPYSWHTEVRHEVGHLLGFDHAGFQRTSDVGVEAYGGLGSIMANHPYQGQPTGLALWRKGWLPETSAVDASLVSGTDVVLRGLAIDDADALKMVRIPADDGSGDFFGVTTRRGSVGTNDEVLDTTLRTGAMVRREGEGGKTIAIDGTPETATKTYDDGVLWPNRSLQVGGYHLTVTHSGADDVEVHVEPDDPTNGAPVNQGFTSPPFFCLGGKTRVATSWTDPDGDPVYTHWRIGVEEGDTYSQGSYATGPSICVDPGKRVWAQGTDRKGGVTWAARGGNSMPNPWLDVRRTGLGRASEEDCDGASICARFAVIAHGDDPDNDPVWVLDWGATGGEFDEGANGRANGVFLRGGLGPHFLSAVVSDGALGINADSTVMLERSFEDQGAGACGDRVASAMAFHEGSGETVLFGGQGIVSSTTCVFDGTSWSVRAQYAPPTARYAAAMAYDVRNDQVVMYGGIDAVTGAVLNDTWTWDGVSWTEVVGASLPLPRVHPAMSGVDLQGSSDRYGAVLYGGELGATGLLSNDLWFFDGTGWVEGTVQGDHPGHLRAASAVFDPGYEEVYLFGGMGGSGATNDTFACSHEEGTDTLDCSEVGGAGPSARGWANLVWDPAARRAVLLGGVPTPTSAGLTDVWELDGEAWVEVTDSSATIVPRSRAAVHGVDGVEQLVTYGGKVGGTIQDVYRTQDLRDYTP